MEQTGNSKCVLYLQYMHKLRHAPEIALQTKVSHFTGAKVKLGFRNRFRGKVGPIYVCIFNDVIDHNYLH